MKAETPIKQQVVVGTVDRPRHPAVGRGRPLEVHQGGAQVGGVGPDAPHAHVGGAQVAVVEAVLVKGLELAQHVEGHLLVLGAPRVGSQRGQRQRRSPRHRGPLEQRGLKAHPHVLLDKVEHVVARGAGRPCHGQKLGTRADLAKPGQRRALGPELEAMARVEGHGHRRHVAPRPAEPTAAQQPLAPRGGGLADGVGSRERPAVAARKHKGRRTRRDAGIGHQRLGGTGRPVWAGCACGFHRRLLNQYPTGLSRPEQPYDMKQGTS